MKFTEAPESIRTLTGMLLMITLYMSNEALSGYSQNWDSERNCCLLFETLPFTSPPRASQSSNDSELFSPGSAVSFVTTPRAFDLN